MYKDCIDHRQFMSEHAEKISALVYDLRSKGIKPIIVVHSEAFADGRENWNGLIGMDLTAYKRFLATSSLKKREKRELLREAEKRMNSSKSFPLVFLRTDGGASTYGMMDLSTSDN